MATPWPDADARERYIRFLELELELMRAVAAGAPAPTVLSELTSLMTRWFPKTRAFIEARLEGDPAGGFSDDVMAVAWAEARAAQLAGGPARVPGEWSESEIAEDINGCFREAKKRAGL